jgi:hypothetical protein
MTTNRIKAIQEKIGAEPDGFWGPKSMVFCKAYLAGLMPSPHPWPSSDQDSLQAFYGSPGDETQLQAIAAPPGLIYEGVQCKVIRCHRRVAGSLLRILGILVRQYPEIASQYAGCFNNRPMRGGSTPSLHARGAAVDFDPDNNGNHQHWPASATMPFGVMEIFAREGWLSAGAFWGRDSMHFQATR